MLQRRGTPCIQAQKVVQTTPLNTFKAKPGSLHRTEPRRHTIRQRRHLSPKHHAFQFSHPISRYVLMNVIMPLATKTLQHKLTVDTGRLTQPVSGKSIGSPFRFVLLHPQLKPHVPALVLLVKIALMLVFIGSKSSTAL